MKYSNVQIQLSTRGELSLDSGTIQTKFGTFLQDCGIIMNSSRSENILLLLCTSLLFLRKTDVGCVWCITSVHCLQSFPCCK